MTEPKLSELEFIPTEVLRNELLRRGDCGIIVLMRKNVNGPGKHQMLRAWQGDPHDCLGLCERMKHMLNQGIDATETPRGAE